MLNFHLISNTLNFTCILLARTHVHKFLSIFLLVNRVEASEGVGCRSMREVQGGLNMASQGHHEACHEYFSFSE